ncbi:MAG TPA: DUF6184 family natural product biosynthesis lipoprotein [Polyangiaceae bacterium]|nr:DUF6184 family natural product biosynthesis lipoprotein [Polyangiaceae bacterium]
MNRLSDVATRAGFISLTAGLLSLVGCSKVNEPEPATAHNDGSVLTPTENMTPASSTRTAAEQIAQARCEREQQCGNIGKDQTFSSSADCLTRIRNDWKDELNARECPGGINEHELNECLGQVRGEACSNPFDTLARITECTSGQICIEKK